ncbi:MAG: hypothetical protein QXP36_06705 [Conexivisphaerales archaeon]
MLKIVSYYKLDYVNHIAQRKHIIVDRVRYIGKESNNLEETIVLGLDRDSYIEYENLEEFYDWVLKLKPKDLKNEKISQQSLYYQKKLIKNGKQLNFKTKAVKKL